MGGAALGGYYEITAIVDGYDSSYDKQEYITSYYDADTGKNSYTINGASYLYVADRSGGHTGPD